MSTPLHNDELEDFLRQQANDHRMYPSDKLWRNIQLTLHGETRWPALTYISIFIIAALVVTTLLMKPEERLKKNVAVYTNANTSGTTSEEILANRTDAAQNSPVQHAYTDKITQHTIEAVNDKVYNEQHTPANLIALGEHYTEKGSITIVQTKSVSSPAAIAASIEKTTESSMDETVTVKNRKEEIASLNAAGKPASIYFST